jgi:outer membrane protein OmpA-like peptidoglycan-associated protein
MTRLPTPTRLRSSLLILSLLAATGSLLLPAGLASAQPVDDPGLSEPEPAKPKPQPTPAPTPPPQPGKAGGSTIREQPASPAAQPAATPTPPPTVTETVDTKVSYVDGGDKATQAEGDLYDRVAAPSIGGPVGLFRVLTGDAGRMHHFRVALHIGGFQQDNFLVAGSGGLRGDTNGSVQGALTISYTPWKYIELFLAIFNRSNSNVRNDPGRTDPEVILSLGDVSLGAKGRYPVARFLDLALATHVRFLNSVSGVSVDGKSTNWSIDAIASFDLRHAARTAKVPLRFHLNFGFLLDNSLNLLPAGQCANSMGNDPCIRSRVVQTFAYGIGTHRLRVAAAIDAPILLPRHVGLAPFIEYHIDASVGDGDQTVARALRLDRSIAADRITNPVQQYLTIGLRLRPIAGLIIDAGVDVGLQSAGFQFGPPVAPWQLMVGAGYAYDPTASRGKTKVVEKTIVRELAAKQGRVRGVVRDADTRQPLKNVHIVYPRHRVTAQLTDEHGTFASYALPPGPVAIQAARDDYESATVESTVLAGSEVPVEILLKAKPPEAGQLRIRVTEPSGQPVSMATVNLTSTSGAIVEAEIESPGSFVAKLPPGEYTLDAVAQGFLARQRQVAIQTGQVQSVDVVLARKPATSRVSLGQGEIKVKGVIHFGTNNADIRPDSEQLLDEVVDLLVRNPQIKKLRIEGHTDNRGNPQKNLELSKARAASVKAYLLKQGIDPMRLDSEGYGATQPLVPNLTPAQRARNRRVAFKIVE